MPRVRRKSVNDINEQRNRLLERTGITSNRGQRIRNIAERYRSNIARIQGGPTTYSVTRDGLSQGYQSTRDNNARYTRRQYMGQSRGASAG